MKFYEHHDVDIGAGSRFGPVCKAMAIKSSSADEQKETQSSTLALRPMRVAPSQRIQELPEDMEEPVFGEETQRFEFDDLEVQSVQSVQSYKSFLSWTSGTYDEYPKPPNRLAHEVASKKTEVFMQKVLEDPVAFELHIQTKLSRRSSRSSGHSKSSALRILRRGLR